MSATRITVLSGGLGSPSQTGLLADAVAAALHAQQPAVEVEIVQLKEYGADMLAALGAFAPEQLRRVFHRVAASDAVVVLTPILNAAPAGLVKLFLDVLPEGTLRAMPVLMGATGGTSRHSLALDYALRPVLTYLHADVLTTDVFVATADWGGAPDVRPVQDRIAAAAEQLMQRVALRRGGGAGQVPASETGDATADQLAHAAGLELEEPGGLEAITRRLERLSPPPATPPSSGRGDR